MCLYLNLNVFSGTHCIYINQLFFGIPFENGFEKQRNTTVPFLASDSCLCQWHFNKLLFLKCKRNSFCREFVWNSLERSVGSRLTRDSFNFYHLLDDIFQLFCTYLWRRLLFRIMLSLYLLYSVLFLKHYPQNSSFITFFCRIVYYIRFIRIVD